MHIHVHAHVHAHAHAHVHAHVHVHVHVHVRGVVEIIRPDELFGTCTCSSCVDGRATTRHFLTGSALRAAVP